MTLFEEVNKQKQLMGIITENINQANKLLAQSGMSQEHPQVAGIRELLTRYKKMAWYGTFIKFYINQKIPVRVIEPLVKKLTSKQIKLPKQVENFESFSELLDTVRQLTEDRKLHLFINKIPEGKLKEEVVSEIHSMSRPILEFMDLDPKCIKMFFKKINRIEFAQHLKDELRIYISNNESGGADINTDILETVNGLGDTQAQVVFSENNTILIRIKTFQASETLGSRAWCIVQDSQHFYEYTADDNRLYFLINTNMPICDNEQSIGYVMNPENELTDAHYKNDAVMNLSEVKPYLKNLGILETVYTINQRETFREAKYSLYDMVGDDKGKIPKFGDQLNKGQNLDLIVHNLENVPTYYWTNDVRAIIYDGNIGKQVKSTSINLLDQLFYYLETGEATNLFDLRGNISYYVDREAYSIKYLLEPLFKTLMGDNPPDEFVKL